MKKRKVYVPPLRSHALRYRSVSFGSDNTVYAVSYCRRSPIILLRYAPQNIAYTEHSAQSLAALALVVVLADSSSCAEWAAAAPRSASRSLRFATTPNSVYAKSLSALRRVGTVA